MPCHLYQLFSFSLFRFYSSFMRTVLAHSRNSFGPHHILNCVYDHSWSFNFRTFASVNSTFGQIALSLSLLRTRSVLMPGSLLWPSVVFYDHCMRNVFFSLRVHHFSSFEHILYTYIPSSRPSTVAVAVAVGSAHFHSWSCFD